MRVLFLAETPLSLTSFQSVIPSSRAVGTTSTIAIHTEREVGWRDSLLAEVERNRRDHRAGGGSAA